MGTQKANSRFLKTDSTRIVNGRGKEVILKGLNLGGWLMMEGYFLHAPNTAEQFFKKDFSQKLGVEALLEFENNFRLSFIDENDFKKIGQLGFNCVRLPFNFRLIEKKPYFYDQAGLKYLDRAVRWAKKNNIYVILDLHAAVGAQNHDWHSDSDGAAKLWEVPEYQERTYQLWEFLADHFKDEPAIAGYDLLNESVTRDVALLNEFYRMLIKRIRKADRNHIIFVEGNLWATDLDCLDPIEDDNYSLSVHTYQPLDFTFNFVPQLRYPLTYGGMLWNKPQLKKRMGHYRRISKKLKAPIFVGEFGVNSREGIYGEDKWLSDILSIFADLGFSWTYWTYKAVKHNIFPDGLLSYMENPAWVNRQGPLTGWNTYANLWPKHKDNMIESWKTRNFKMNTSLLKVFKDAVR